MPKNHASPPVPLTILSGFLGVGKTTLLNRLLASDLKGQRVALIVNDFGKIVIDGSLIKSRGETMLQLKNGCICCSLQQNLAEGMANLLQAGPFDRIVMETSGVTSLANLLEVLGNGLPAFKPIRVDLVVTVVDAERFEVMRNAFAFVVDQVKHADAIVLNRCDRVSEADRVKVRRSLENLNTAALIVETNYCAIEPGLLGMQSGSDRSIPASRHETSLSADQSHETITWYTSRIVLGSGVNLAELRTALAQLPDTIQRLKGFCQADGQIWSVQKAGRVLDIEPADGDIPGELIGQIVAIGSAPLQALLTEVFGSWDGVEIIEDTTAHTHHGHHHDPST